MKRQILGISRSTKYSPTSENRDAAIFAAVASRLNRGENEVSLISEDLFIAVDLSEFDLVFSMARGREVLKSLSLAETENLLKVVNSPTSLLTLSRANIVRNFQQNEIPIPRCEVVSLENVGNLEIAFPYWLKRADACAQNSNDVCFIENKEQLVSAITAFTEQGTATIVAEAHLKGDLIKFYGVEGTDFFSFSYPTDDGGFSKFGLEQKNGKPNYFVFDQNKLKMLADKAAKSIGLTIYGGDAIVQADGSIRFIDFNDWPSFSSCRKEAARAIANRINQILHKS